MSDSKSNELNDVTHSPRPSSSSLDLYSSSPTHSLLSPEGEHHADIFDEQIKHLGEEEASKEEKKLA